MKNATLIVAALCGMSAFAALRSTTPTAPAVDSKGGKWWHGRHAQLLERAKNGNGRIVFLGDSITQGWETRGKNVWEKYFAGGRYHAINLGVSGDRTEHVLWRIANGELDGYDAKAIVLLIGTNNTGHFKREDEPPENTVLGIKAILEAIRAKQSKAMIVMCAIFPRGKASDDQGRLRNAVVNKEIAKLANGRDVFWCDISDLFLTTDGDLPAEIFPDYLHPQEPGYEIWANAVLPFLDAALDGSMETGFRCHNRYASRLSAKEFVIDAKTPPPLAGDGVTDDTAAIQALLDTGRSCVVLPPPKDHYVISKTLIIGSGQELRLDRFTRVRLAKGSDCFMLANRNRETGDKRIALTGGIWDFDNVSQSPNPQQAHRCNPPVKVALPKSYDPAFFMGILMSFKAVDDLQIRHVTFRNPGSYCCQLAGVSNFRVDDVTFDFDKWNPIRLNMDGIHLDGDCHHGRITDLFGTCFDDLVAVNANDGFCSPKEAPITDIEIDGIHAEYCHSAVRILSAGAEIRRVSVRNVFGNFYTYAVGLTHFFPQKPRGTFEDILIENVFAAKALAPDDIGAMSRVNFPLVWLQGPVDAGSVTVRNFARTERTVPVATIRIDKEATVRRLTVRDCRMANELKEPIFFIENLGKVETLVGENNDFEGEWKGRDGKNATSPAAVNPPPKVDLAEYDWYEGSDFGLEGQAWPDMLAPYARIPRKEEPTLPPGPKRKGTWAVGLHVRFVTDSDVVLVRSVAKDPFSGKFGHVGRDGLDLYRRASRGEWRYHERRKWFEGVTNCFHAVWSPGEAGIVYLPQIGVVESFRIGVKKGSFLRRFPHESGVKKPVVHYGTSIVQGGEASRAGLMFTSVASRLADVPYANLGFSGNGWLEMEVARMLARAEASLYVVDCGWNTRIFDHATVKSRTLSFLRLLHEKHPETPILLCEAAHNGVEPRWEPCEIKMTLKDFNKPYREAYEELKREIPNLHYLPQEGLLPEDGEALDDFVHPNDYGMMRMGRVFAEKISAILGGCTKDSQ